MLKNIRFYWVFCTITMSTVCCQNRPEIQLAAVKDTASMPGVEKSQFSASAAVPALSAYPEERGKSKRKLASSVLIPALPDTLPFIEFDPVMLQAMYQQTNYLLRPDVKDRGTSGISRAEMLKSLELLEGVQLLDPKVLLKTFDFYRINTEIKRDKVRITGYYTPLVYASRVRSENFKFPIYARPEKNVPNPAAIKRGALEGRNLELAWFKTKKEVENAQLQGSCLVEFPDGKRTYFGFGGSVKGAGGTHVFFTKVDETVLGSGFFPLTAGYSIAVDPRYIPIGSTIFAELPDLDAAGNLKGYTYRILFAQDRGGAIKTTK
ncbi:MAG: MltA domain-containing protein, partial [Bacteroidetes bacterium]|nr:MltA domain-containing protein [Bacteroidota bacterium]